MGSKVKPWKDKPRNGYVYAMNQSRKSNEMRDRRVRRPNEDNIRDYVEEWDEDPQPID